MDITEIRRVNIRTLVEKRGMLSKLSKALGYKNPSFLSQMVGPNPTREVTEKFARRVEEAAGLEPGALDRPRDGVPAQAPAPAAQTPVTAPRTDTLVVDVIRMVGKVCEAEGVAPSPMRFADLVALAYLDSVEHGGQARESHIKAVARLLR